MKRKLLMFIAALLLGGVMYAQNDGYNSTHWPDFDYHQFQKHMTIIGQVYFNDEVQNSGDIEVAAFVGNELRGRWNLICPFPNDPDPEWQTKYFVYLPCYYNTAGETFTFKAFDYSTNKEYDVCTTTAEGQDDGYGNEDYPYDFYFTFEEEPTYGPEHPWTPSTDYSGDGMLVVAQIQINGVNVNRATYEVGAFCGEECRGTSGVALDDWTDVEMGYFAFFNILGDDNDVINFYLYDLESDEMCPVKCYTTVTLENDGELGLDYEDDLFVLNFVTEQTFTLDITGYTADAEIPDHYYLIASPIGEVSPSKVTSMLDNEYDLYYFDQTSEEEWINIKDGQTNLVTGKGYLYANSQDVTLKFKGFPYNGNGDVTLFNNVGDNTTTAFGGWNLVGNPYAETASVDKAFYTMNQDGNDVIAGTGNNVGAMEGIFVVAETDGEVLHFSPAQSNNGKSQIVLNVIRDRGAVVDRAIVRFGEESSLPKFMLNENNTKLYIPQDNKDYAVVTCGEAGEIPVSFKADHNGSYTINVSTDELDVNYMHLIDNLTGTDVDLLQNPSYNFNAQTTDYASRFKLVFATGVSNDDNFGFYSNGSWIINNDGDAILQVVDVTGRIMSNEEIHGSFSKRIEAAPGVYMLRLVKGSDVKVQKIVVK